MTPNTKRRLMRWIGLTAGGVMAAVAVSATTGRLPGAAVTAGIILATLTFGLRRTGAKPPAAVPHERLQLSLQSAMLQVMLADGALDAGEAKRAVEVYRALTAIDMPEEAVHEQARVALSGGEDDVRRLLERLAGELTQEERATVLKGAVMTAVVDGDLETAERPAVGEVAETLGLGAAEIRAVVAELSAGRR